MLSKTSILNVSVTTSSRVAILSSLSRFFSTRRPSQPIIKIVTPNVEQVVLAQKNKQFREVLNNADIALPDGAGLVWGMKHLRNVIPAKAGIQLDHGIPARTSFGRNDKKVVAIPGRLFMIDFCRIAAQIGKRVLFYGGRNRVAEQAMRKLKQQIPGLDGFAMDGADIEGEVIPKSITEELIRTIRSRNMSVVFIGLGAPKQEFLMDTFKGATLQGSPLVLMSVGGSFDTISGRIPEAPALFQKLGIEFLWRLIIEPSRLRRQLALAEFVWMVIAQKS